MSYLHVATPTVLFRRGSHSGAFPPAPGVEPQIGLPRLSGWVENDTWHVKASNFAPGLHAGRRAGTGGYRHSWLLQGPSGFFFLTALGKISFSDTFFQMNFSLA